MNSFLSNQMRFIYSMSAIVRRDAPYSTQHNALTHTHTTDDTINFEYARHMDWNVKQIKFKWSSFLNIKSIRVYHTWWCARWWWWWWCWFVWVYKIIYSTTQLRDRIKHLQDIISWAAANYNLYTARVLSLDRTIFTRIYIQLYILYIYTRTS